MCSTRRHGSEHLDDAVRPLVEPRGQDGSYYDADVVGSRPPIRTRSRWSVPPPTITPHSRSGQVRQFILESAAPADIRSSRDWPVILTGIPRAAVAGAKPSCGWGRREGLVGRMTCSSARSWRPWRCLAVALRGRRATRRTLLPTTRRRSPPTGRARDLRLGLQRLQSARRRCSRRTSHSDPVGALPPAAAHLCRVITSRSRWTKRGHV